MSCKETDLIISKISSLKELGLISKVPLSKKQVANVEDTDIISKCIQILRSDWITKTAGYFMNHRDSSDYCTLDCEEKIQDLVYIQLTSIIPDLHYEDPQSKTKGSITSTRIDFSSKTLNLGIEIKHAKGKHNAKKIESEISEDIVKYGKSRKFDNIIFFIFCYNYNFPNADQFERGFSDSHTISGFSFETICIIK